MASERQVNHSTLCGSILWFKSYLGKHSETCANMLLRPEVSFGFNLAGSDCDVAVASSRSLWIDSGLACKRAVVQYVSLKIENGTLQCGGRCTNGKLW